MAALPNAGITPIWHMSVERCHAMIDTGNSEAGDPVELLEAVPVQKTPQKPGARVYNRRYARSAPSQPADGGAIAARGCTPAQGVKRILQDRGYGRHAIRAALAIAPAAAATGSPSAWNTTDGGWLNWTQGRSSVSRAPAAVTTNRHACYR